MKNRVTFGLQSRDYKLTKAILIYESGEGQSAHSAASVHDIAMQDRRPVIQPGHAITVSAVKQLAAALGQSQSIGYLPERLICIGLEKMVWWCPAGRRRIWFKPSHADSPGKLEVKPLNGKFVHHPPLLFMVESGLNVFALTGNARPRPETNLYRAPYWNLTDGHMCNGNLKLPEINPEHLADFEAAFFNSAFTHTSQGTLTRHPDGHAGMWTELSRRKTPPAAAYWKKNLITYGKTVAQILK